MLSAETKNGAIRIERVRSLSILSTQISALCLSLTLLSACGYQFRVEGAGPTIGGAEATSSSTSPPPRLVIQALENKSFEPNLETR